MSKGIDDGYLTNNGNWMKLFDPFIIGLSFTKKEKYNEEEQQ